MMSRQSDSLVDRRVLHTKVPASSALHRLEIYRGAIFRLHANEQSKRLTEYVVTLIEEHLGNNPRMAQFSLGVEAVFDAVATITKNLRNDEFKRLLNDVMLSWGFDPEENPICGISKGVRFRAHIHSDPSQESYFGVYHRETWFGHPQEVINWWLPLYDVGEDETFSFYPDWFQTPIANNSAGFVAREWYKELGDNWGRDKKTSKDYHLTHPRVTALDFDPKTRLRFSAKAGEIILFSGQHVHKTNSEVAGRTRFNLDFRTYNIQDRKDKLGPPNIDNEINSEAMIS